MSYDRGAAEKMLRSVKSEIELYIKKNAFIIIQSLDIKIKVYLNQYTAVLRETDQAQEPCLMISFLGKRTRDYLPGKVTKSL
jgi:hypothetical protein